VGRSSAEDEDWQKNPRSPLLSGVNLCKKKKKEKKRTFQNGEVPEEEHWLPFSKERAGSSVRAKDSICVPKKPHHQVAKKRNGKKVFPPDWESEYPAPTGFEVSSLFSVGGAEKKGVQK